MRTARVPFDEINPHPSTLYAGPCLLLGQLPPELLQVIAEHLEAPADVKVLSRTCRALHDIAIRPAMMAGWLWRWYGNNALFRLMRIAPSNSIAVLRHLVEVHHANVNSTTHRGTSLLQAACLFEAGDDVLSYLLADPDIDVNANGTTFIRPLHLAASTGRLHAVRQLLAHPDINVNVAADAVTSLHLAIAGSHMEVLRELLAHPDINLTAGRVSALSYATLCDDAAAVALILRHPSVNPNAEMRRACLRGNVEIVRQFLQHPGLHLDFGAVDQLMHDAAVQGNTAVMALLKGHRAVRRALRARGRP